MENKISILIIEDEAIIAHSLKLLLEDLGYEVARVCYNYETALEAIETVAYDIAISDINLGAGTMHKSGLALMSYVHEIKKCPFIFLTASGDKETVKEAAACRPSAYLVKPINETNLHVAIQLAIENFKSQGDTPQPAATSGPDFFYVKIGTRLKKILWQDVDYMEALKNYVRLYTPQHKSGVLIRGSLQQVYGNMMPASHRPLYVRINRSMIVSKKHITEIGNDFVITPFGQMECSAELKREDFSIG